MRRVNTRSRGDVFGEMSLVYNCPRSATVVATSDCVVWVLGRAVFRDMMQQASQDALAQREVFLNSVPLLAPLPAHAKANLVDALDEKVYPPGTRVVSGQCHRSFPDALRRNCSASPTSISRCISSLGSLGHHSACSERFECKDSARNKLACGY